jgi:hypothetical protein
MYNQFTRQTHFINRDYRPLRDTRPLIHTVRSNSDIVGYAWGNKIAKSINPPSKSTTTPPLSGPKSRMRKEEGCAPPSRKKPTSYTEKPTQRKMDAGKGWIPARKLDSCRKSVKARWTLTAQM